MKLQFRVFYRDSLFRIVDLELLAPQGVMNKLLGQFTALLINRQLVDHAARGARYLVLTPLPVRGSMLFPPNIASGLRSRILSFRLRPSAALCVRVFLPQPLIQKSAPLFGRVAAAMASQVPLVRLFIREFSQQ